MTNHPQAQELKTTDVCHLSQCLRVGNLGVSSPVADSGLRRLKSSGDYRHLKGPRPRASRSPQGPRLLTSFERAVSTAWASSSPPFLFLASNAGFKLWPTRMTDNLLTLSPESWKVIRGIKWSEEWDFRKKNQCDFCSHPMI